MNLGENTESSYGEAGRARLQQRKSWNRKGVLVAFRCEAYLEKIYDAST